MPHLRILLAFTLSMLALGCGSDPADTICTRLEACGCLDESANDCENRIEGSDSEDLEVCGECLEVHDHMCHELTTGHGACRRCADKFASPGLGRDVESDGKEMGRDVVTMCIPGGGWAPTLDAGTADGGS